MSLEIPLRVETVGSGQVLGVFFHGMFGTAFGVDGPSRYEVWAKKLSERLPVTIGLYETSRNTRKPKDADFITWATESFKGKTFSDELQDVELALEDFSIERYRSVVFLGFSLGGTLSTFFLDKYLPTTVQLWGSGCETKAKNLPIGSTYPEKETILKNLGMYQGKLKVYQGTSDTVVPKSGAQEMLRAATYAEKRFVSLDGVDHTFTTRDGMIDPTLDAYIFEQLEGALR